MGRATGDDGRAGDNGGRGMTRLAYPWMLLLLLLIPALWYLWTRPAPRRALRFSSLDVIRAAGHGRSGRIRLVLPLLRTVALGCLVLAAARPQRADETSRVYAEGVAIQLVLDTSTSMEDTDLSPPGKRLTRLDVVKDVVGRFIHGDGELSGRPNDLIGLIRFAGYADSICPLTLDRLTLKAILDSVRMVTTREEDGTAIGDALALAVERLRNLERTTGSGERLRIVSRVIILLTDGEDNAGLLRPVQAGELAAHYGVKVYTIMAGTGALRAFGGRAIPEDADLRKIAELSGGKHFRATDDDSLRHVYQEIDKLERTHVEEQRFARYRDLAGPWLLVAFIALGLQMLLDATLLRKIP